MTVEHANNVILACCVLHNFLRTKALTAADPTNFADIVEHNGNVVNGAWREDPTNFMPGIRRTNARNAPVSALGVREHLINYFNTTGSVVWQDIHVRRTS